MFNKSIAYQLGIYISLAVISVFIAFIATSYFFNRKLTKENIENRAIGISAEISTEIKKLVVTTREVASNVSEQILFYGEKDEADLLISGVMEKYPFINALNINIDSTVSGQPFQKYMAFRQNDSVFFRKGDFNFYKCEAEEEIVKNVILQKKPNWTEPFRCPRNKNVVVLYYYPITLKNKQGIVKHAGEVICELSLLNLNDSINSKKIENQGFAFLVSKNGDFITHPREEWILNRNIFTLSNKIIDNKNKSNEKELIARQKPGSIILKSETLGYEKSWAYFTPIKENGWTLIFIMPYYKLFEPLYLNILRMLLISVLGILSVYFLITYISKKLVEPLSNVASQLRKFSIISDDYPVNTFNEVRLVSESLKDLKSRFENYREIHSIEQKKSHSRMEDLLQASEIQRGLIKLGYPAFPDRKDIDLFVIYKPAKIVSGDLFDYFFIDNDNLVISIGDVSGKGIPAAFFMSIAQTLIKSNANVKKAKKIVGKANRELYTNNQHQFFLTLFLGVLNLRTGMLNYCNAAHTSTLILKPSGEICDLEHSHGLPLGLYPDKEYSESRIQIEKGDTLILYTDGVTELQDANKFHFGEERFKENLSHLAGQKPKEIAKRIENGLEVFKGEAEQSDDITMMILKFYSD
jgi:sigma-B regulation protein RsbU (phosphoserine phosphatase)